MRHLRLLKRCFFWLSLTAFLVTLVLFIIYSLQYGQTLQKAQKQYRSLQKDAIQRSPPQSISASKKKQQKLSAKKNDLHKKIVIPDVNFSYLWKQNRDIYAWIIIPHTTISYPVLQHSKSDTYYLNHNLDDSTGYPGCIFSKTHSKKDFTDALLILYGHNMRNGTMFGSLRQLDKLDFSKKSYFIYIITPTSKILYRIRSSAVWCNKDILYTFSNTSDSVYHFVRTINLHGSSKSKEALLKASRDKKSQWLVLSTCGSNSKTRFLIISQKQKEWRK